MTSVSAHHPFTHLRFSSPMRIVLVTLLALAAYLFVSETAAGESKGVLILSSDFKL